MNWFKKNWGSLIFWGFLIVFFIYAYSNNEPKSETNIRGEYTEFNRLENSGEIENSVTDYDTGYNWAEENGIDNFDDCQNKFDTSDAEDGCNEYVKENNTGYQSFNGYKCTEDCSGHEAGYNWAEENGITDEGDCGGNSQSFIEGCVSYAEENY